jgi:hypothetical protein
VAVFASSPAADLARIGVFRLATRSRMRSSRCDIGCKRRGERRYGYMGGGRRRDAAEMGFIHSASPVPLGTDAGLVWRRTHLLDALLLPGLDVTGSRGGREGDVLRGHLRRGRHGVLLVPVHPRWGRLRHSSSDAGHEMGREGRGHRPGACRAGVRSRFRRKSSSAKRRSVPCVRQRLRVRALASGASGRRARTCRELCNGSEPSSPLNRHFTVQLTRQMAS